MAGAQDSKAKRDGKFIEEIGAYYPVAESELERKEKLKVLRLEHVRGHSQAGSGVVRARQASLPGRGSEPPCLGASYARWGAGGRGTAKPRLNGSRL